MAQSLGAVIEIIILLAILEKRSGRKLLTRDFWQGTIRMTFATVIAGCVAFSLTKFIPLMATDVSLVITVPKFLIITAGSVVAYVIASYFLDLDEVKPVLARVKKILFRNVK